MTAPHIVDPATVLGEALTDASPDLMRHLLQTMINALLSADADSVVGAEWGKPSLQRVTHRNGYRHRDLDTRAGTIDVASPELRSGTYFPEWLLERRKRSDAALVTVIADHYQGRNPPPTLKEHPGQLAVSGSCSITKILAGFHQLPRSSGGATFDYGSIGRGFKSLRRTKHTRRKESQTLGGIVPRIAFDSFHIASALCSVVH
jgi:hypothetical protein